MESAGCQNAFGGAGRPAEALPCRNEHVLLDHSKAGTAIQSEGVNGWYRPAAQVALVDREGQCDLGKIAEAELDGVPAASHHLAVEANAELRVLRHCQATSQQQSERHDLEPQEHSPDCTVRQERADSIAQNGRRTMALTMRRCTLRFRTSPAA